MNNCENKIYEICNNASANVYDIYYAIYIRCFELENSWETLKSIMKIMKNCKFSKEEEGSFVSVHDVEAFKSAYLELLQVYTNSLIKKNLPEDEFYKQLYNTLFVYDIFPKDKKTLAIIICLLVEEIMIVPYFQATDLLIMSDEDYKKHVNELEPEIFKTISIFKRQFSTRTEESSQLYKVLLSLNEEEDKIVYLSILIGMMQGVDEHQMGKDIEIES